MGFALRLSPIFRAVRLPRFDRARAAEYGRDTRGNAAVEFAIVGPVLVLLLMGIFTYGGYFLTAHTVQQMANDAARSAIAGLDDEERLMLARESALASLSSQAHLRGAIANLDLRRDGPNIAINLTYDASEDLYWSFESLLPVPAPQISRTATIRLGGV